MIPLVALVIGAHAWTIVPHAFEHDQEPDYYHFVLRHIQYCDPNQLPYTDDSPINARNQLKWWLHCESWHITGSAKYFLLFFNIFRGGFLHVGSFCH